MTKCGARFLGAGCGLKKPGLSDSVSRLVGLLLGDVSLLDHVAQHLHLPVVGVLRVQKRIVQVRILWNPGEHRRLREVKMLRGGDAGITVVGVAKVGARRRVDSVGLLPIGNRVQIHLDDLPLGEDALSRHPIRQNGFLDLALEGLVAIEHVLLDELLRDRAAALADAVLHDIGVGRADDRVEIDALVIPEGMIFDGDGRVDDADRYLRQRYAVLHASIRKFVEQDAICVVDADTILRRDRAVESGDVRGAHLVIARCRADRSTRHDRHQDGDSHCDCHCGARRP